MLVDLGDPSLLLNRELSLLAFNARVLAQAADASVPLLERLRFLTISCTNLDEFFEIRVAGLREQVNAGVAAPGPDGLVPKEALRRIRASVLDLVREQYRLLGDILLPALAAEGIVVLRRHAWSDAQREWTRRFFTEQVLPLLTPIALDPSHPFPTLLNKILTFAVRLEGQDAFGRDAGIAVVQAGRTVPRLIPMPADVAGVPHGFVLLSSLIGDNIGALFPGMTVVGCHPFRVTRDSDLWVDEEEVDDLLDAIKGELPRRHFGDAVRLEVSRSCPDDTARFLLEQLDLGEDALYRVDGPVNPARLVALHDVDRPDLKYPVHRPAPSPRLARSDPFDAIRAHDVLLHHPYESFSPVLDLLRQVAQDPAVVAVKTTLYRTGPRSEVAEALVRAAQAGKEVTAVIELRARFDEAANVELATRLQEAGASVVYGVVGYKTHAKMMLFLRREDGGLRRYVHLGTGNYHTATARAYTDVSLLSADPSLGADVHRLFQELTGLGTEPALLKLVVAPFRLREQLLERIGNQARLAAEGKPSRIVAKLNSLSEPSLVTALYTASQAGVPVDLIVRGICALRPGLPGISEHIRVHSIVGRFLEHARVWAFGAELDELYCGSADWMHRNLFRRVETAFPITDPELRARVVDECLLAPLAEGVLAWELRSDGTYARAPAAGGLSLQELLLTRYAERSRSTNQEDMP